MTMRVRIATLLAAGQLPARVCLPILCCAWLTAARVDAAAPDAPAYLGATASAPGQVTLAWPAASGAASYHVYRSLESAVTLSLPFTWSVSTSATLVASVGSTTFVDAGLDTLVRYSYAVTSVNDEGESAPAPFGAAVTTTASPEAPIWGFADVHNHQIANLGFGGRMFWGEPYDAGGLPAAVPWCTPAHGPGGVGDLISQALTGSLIPGHLVGGNPQFDGWPRWNSYTHQGAYIDWVERAFRGGMKLMVVHAVNNEVLCNASDHPLGCDDMAAVDRQLKAAKEIASVVPWYQIAYSAEQARHIINSGNLAVVLGIEVDKLFGCAQGGGCTDQSVKDSLAYYYAQGARHFFPVHVFDNAFGGAAEYETLFNYGNKLINGQFFDSTDCSAGGVYAYTLQPAGFPLNVIAYVMGAGNPAPTGYTADCNARGLTPLGASLMRKLMSRKAIIDVDHMSARMADDALLLAASAGYPVVAGHTGLIGTSLGPKRSEGQKSDAQLERIHQLHGLVAPILHQGKTSEIAAYGAIPNDCSNSSKTFAQAYLYAVDHMGGDAVGLGTDFNGLAGEPGPRFGPEACPGGGVPQTDPGVSYPFAPFGKQGVLRQSVVGDKTFDYNVDGLAHIGMLPDLIQDLRVLGVTDAQLTPLFHSAEAYIDLWARAEQRNLFPPAIAATLAPAPNAAGWNRSDATLTITATESADGWPVDAVTYSATGAQATGSTRVDGATAALVLSAEGTTGVSFFAADDANNVSATGSATIHLDKSAPAVTCGAADLSWHASDVVISCSAADTVSGLAAAADASFQLATSVPAGTETATASTSSRIVSDVAGNQSAAGPIPNNKVDKKAPSISIVSPASGAVYIVNQPVAADYACSDGGSGVATCSGPVANGSNFQTAAAGSPVFTVAAADQVGNSSSASSGYVVAYNLCVLYDTAKARRAGSTVPIKVALCDYAGANVSTSSVVVTAVGVTQVSTSAPGVLEDAGAANPDNDFRYDASLGGYIFNLQTAGYSTGTYRLALVASGDPTTHEVEFQMK